MHLKLNVTEIDANAQITIRQSSKGHNLLVDTLEKPQTYSQIASGTTLVIGLELLGSVWPVVSFGFQFETSGCGGIIRDFQFISNPGYPHRMVRDEVCVWVFYSLLPQARLEITSINMTSVFGSAGRLSVYDGDKVTDRLLKTYDQDTGSPVQATGSSMLIQFRAYLSIPARGFSALVRGV